MLEEPSIQMVDAASLAHPLLSGGSGGGSGGGAAVSASGHHLSTVSDDDLRTLSLSNDQFDGWTDESMSFVSTPFDHARASRAASASASRRLGRELRVDRSGYYRYGVGGSRRHTCRRLCLGGALLMCIVQASTVAHLLVLNELGAESSLASCVDQVATTVFVLLFSVVFVRTSFNPFTLVAIITIFAGALVITLDNWHSGGAGGGGAGGNVTPGTDNTTTTVPSSSPTPAPSPGVGLTALTNTVSELTSSLTSLSIVLLIVSSAGWALYDVLIATLIPRGTVSDIVGLIAWRGVWNLVIGGSAVFARAALDRPWHKAVLETFDLVCVHYQRLAIVGAFALCATIFVAIAIARTGSAVYVRVASVLVVPACAIVNIASPDLRGAAGFTWQFALGIALCVAGMVAINLPWAHRPESVEGRGEDEEDKKVGEATPARRMCWYLHVVTRPLWEWQCSRRARTKLCLCWFQQRRGLCRGEGAGVVDTDDIARLFGYHNRSPSSQEFERAQRVMADASFSSRISVAERAGRAEDQGAGWGVENFE